MQRCTVRAYRNSCIDSPGEETEKWKPGIAMIKKTKEGYKVTSEKGENLGGPYKSKAEAEKRLRQVEYFKHNKG